MLLVLIPRLLKRSGRRLLLAFSSLLLGACTLAVVLGIIGSVQTFFLEQSRVLMGGDITISSNGPMDSTHPVLDELSTSGVIFSERLDTLVVARTQSPVTQGYVESLLVSLKVVDDNYPLYGELLLSNANIPEKQTPGAREVFVASDVLVRMGISVGDNLQIGNSTFEVAAVISSEPDRVASSFRLGPLAMISQDGWRNTGIDGNQSRIEYAFSLKFPDNYIDSDTQSPLQTLGAAFPRPAYRVSTAEEGPGSLLRILSSAERFFFTMIVLALFLVIVNIRLNLIYFLSSFQKTIAIMRSLGMRKRELLYLFLMLLFFLSLISGIFGTLLGNLAANNILPFAENVIDAQLPPIILYSNLLVVIVFAIFLCMFSALGFLVRVLDIEPKMLLLGYGAEHGRARQLLREAPSLLLTLIGLFAGIYYLTERAVVALTAVSGIAATFALLFLLSRIGVNLGHRLRFSLPFQFRYILNFLRHQGMLGATTIASLTIALATIFSITLIEANMLGNLQSEFKRDAPNIYLLDVQEDQLPGVSKIMGDSWRDFSVVRARFTMRDGYDIQSNLATEDGEMRREFNITSGTEAIEGERVIAGVWHGTEGRGEVSVEKDYAERAKLTLGSKVEFVTQGVILSATVTSIRSVTTTSGLPFFFLVFSPDVLRDIPRTSFGYAFVAEDKIPGLQNELSTAYPNITSIPTTQILEVVAKVVGVLTTAVVGTVIPALLLGLILILAMLGISAQERSNDMLVFTAFGAQTKLLFSLFLIESVAIVLIAGFFAGIIAHVAVLGLNRIVFDFTTFYFAPSVAYVFMGILSVTLIIAFFLARRLTSQSPAALLGNNK